MILVKKIVLFFCITILVFSIGCANVKNNVRKDVEKKLAFVNYDEGYKFGNKDAKIVIVEYSSYECRDCRDLHKNIGSVLKKYVDAGDVLYIYKPVDHPRFKSDEDINKHFAPNSLDDIENVFNKFDSYSKKPYETVKKVLNLKDTEVPNYETMNKAIQTELNTGNINGTPTIYINGKKSEKVLTKEEFQKMLDSL